MPEITYDTFFSTIPTLSCLAFSAHGKVSVLNSSSVYYHLACRGRNRCSEASLDAGYRSPLSNKIPNSMYILLCEISSHKLAWCSYCLCDGRCCLRDSIESKRVFSQTYRTAHQLLNAPRSVATSRLMQVFVFPFRTNPHVYFAQLEQSSIIDSPVGLPRIDSYAANRLPVRAVRNLSNTCRLKSLVSQHPPPTGPTFIRCLLEPVRY